MVAANVLSEILGLPAEQRACLALELLRSLDSDREPGAAAASDAEIERRASEVDSGAAVTMSLDGRGLEVLRLGGDGQYIVEATFEGDEPMRAQPFDAIEVRPWRT